MQTFVPDKVGQNVPTSKTYFQPLAATVSLAQGVAAGVPTHSLVVSLQGSVPERCWIDTSLGVLLQLVSIELSNPHLHLAGVKSPGPWGRQVRRLSNSLGYAPLGGVEIEWGSELLNILVALAATIVGNECIA